jgi:hypothetical protein
MDDVTQNKPDIGEWAMVMETLGQELKAEADGAAAQFHGDVRKAATYLRAFSGIVSAGAKTLRAIEKLP